jgi:hypothetical protein
MFIIKESHPPFQISAQHTPCSLQKNRLNVQLISDAGKHASLGLLISLQFNQTLGSP